MLLDTFEDPKFIHGLMRITTDFCKNWGDAIVATGIRLSFSEPTASISLISPDNYREFIAPYHKELVDYFKAKKVGVTTHICGTTYPIYEDLVNCGFTTISFDLDQQADPKLYVDQLKRFTEVSRGRAVAIGNVDATKFEKTTKEAMEADVRRCVDTAARGAEPPRPPLGSHDQDYRLASRRAPPSLRARRSARTTTSRAWRVGGRSRCRARRPGPVHRPDRAHRRPAGYRRVAGRRCAGPGGSRARP